MNELEVNYTKTAGELTRALRDKADLIDNVNRLKTDLESAHYQIKRAIAQLNEALEYDDERQYDATDSVRAQLKAFMNSPSEADQEV